MRVGSVLRSAEVHPSILDLYVYVSSPRSLGSASFARALAFVCWFACCFITFALHHLLSRLPVRSCHLGNVIVVCVRACAHPAPPKVMRLPLRRPAVTWSSTPLLIPACRPGGHPVASTLSVDTHTAPSACTPTLFQLRNLATWALAPGPGWAPPHCRAVLRVSRLAP